VIDPRPHIYEALVQLLHALERDPETLARLGSLYFRQHEAPYDHEMGLVRVRAEHAVSDLIRVLLGDVPLAGDRT
jgi:hypothetical protein